jgi:hypothetical protein
VAKFRKKPVVIEAVQFTEPVGQCAPAILEMTDFAVAIARHEGRPIVLISTLEGEMRAELGDWIIKGIKGEFYPCKPDIFEETYEPAE